MDKIEVQIKDGKIYAPLKEKWLIEKPEEVVRQKYIAKLVNHYGYNLKQMRQEVKVSNSKRGQGRACADIVIWKSEEEKNKEKKAFIVVECKAENITIKQEDYFQGFNYASWAGASFFVTTNEKETKFFNVDKEYLPKKLQEIIEIPKEVDINDQKKIEKLLKALKVFERDEFAKLLRQCHNIIRDNDKLTPDVAFDETSKILFMKIRYELNPDRDAIFSKEKFLKDEANYKKNIAPFIKGDDKNLPYIQFLFRQTKDEFQKDELFDKNESIRIKQVSFEAIVEKLEKYNLSDTSDDVKGIAFEKFLGTTFRGELGGFFTPRPIVNYIIDTLEPKEGEIICDPCAGSGGFLIKAFEQIREKIEKEINQEKEKIRNKYFDDEFKKLNEKEQEKTTEKVNKYFAQLNEELNTKNKKGRIYNLSHNCIFGTDANPRMARTSKMNMIMHGDGHGGIHHNDGLLNVNGIFENRFDVIITNPPFGSRVSKSLKIVESDKYTDKEKIKRYTERYGEQYTEALKQIEVGKSIIDLFDLGKTSGLTEVLFMERCLKLLKPGGRLGIVLPEGVLNNSGNMQKVREYFESKAKIILITSIPQDVFISSGATVKPSLLFLRKFTEEEETNYNKILLETTKETTEKYKTEQENIKNKKTIKEIKTKIQNEIKQLVKQKFNYTIPIAEVESAGIDSKGAICENQLKPLAEEFNKYRKINKLWKEKIIKYNYNIIDDEVKRKEVVNF